MDEQPAFPGHGFRAAGSAGPAAAPGISKREYFTAAAITGLCANGIPGSHHQPRNLVAAALEIADEVMFVLEGRKL